MTDDPHRILTLAQLREVIPPPKAEPSPKVASELDDEALGFIAASPLVFVATVDGAGSLDVSPKGDDAGFVQAADRHTLLLPERPGNRLAFGFQNILQTGAIGLIFVVPGVRETLRVDGRAELSRDPVLCRRLAARDKPAQLVTRIVVQSCFFHCAKAFIRSRTWEPASWGATAGPGAAGAAVRNWSQRFGMAVGTIERLLDDDYRHNL